MRKLILGLFCGLGILYSVSSIAATAALPSFNATTLKAYNGQQGHKAYVALNGKVYDVSSVPEWANGKHYKGMVAGTDLTPNISRSPHGAGIVTELGLKPIGTYSAAAK